MAPDTFSEYHRARRRSSVLRGAAIALIAAASATGLTLWGVAAANTAPTPASATEQALPTQVAEAQDELDLQLPTLPLEDAPATAPAADLPETGAGEWDITVDTAGYQKELDECEWVRMDLGAAAPIVGAHNYCGGGIVLDMAVGDIVTLAGTGLDGDYVVSEIRDARAGDPAASATAGMAVTAILQTCYWEDNGTVRLVGLVPA